MGFFTKEGGHYAVRRSERDCSRWKIVIAYTDGSSYDDIGGWDLYSTFNEANERANEMNKSRLGQLNK